MSESFDESLIRGLEAHEDGRYEEARTHYRQATRLAPGDPVSWGLLGAAELVLGRLDRAEEALSEAYRLDPDTPGIRLQLALVAAGRGRLEVAGSHLRAAVEKDAEDLEAIRTLCLVAAVAEDRTALDAALADLAARAPEAPELPWLRALNSTSGGTVTGDPAVGAGLAEVLLHWHRPDLSLQVLRAAGSSAEFDRETRLLALNCVAEHRDARLPGDFLRGILRPEESEDSDPQLAVARILVKHRDGSPLPRMEWTTLVSGLSPDLQRRLTGRLIHEKRWAEALETVPPPKSSDPHATAAHRIRGEILYFDDRHDEALGELSAVACEGDPASMLLAAAASCDPVPADDREIERIRRSVVARLDALRGRLERAGDVDVADAFGAIGRIPFFHLAYHGLDDREPNGRIGTIHAEIATRHLPEFAQSPPHRPSRGRVRIGVVSAHLHDHSVWRTITRGWLEGLDAGRFEVHVFDIAATARFGPDTYACVRAIASTEATAREWARRIRARDLDMVLHPEIGMHGLGMQLASLRLAPVQAMAWGHPVTSGLPTIDLFLSADEIEPPDAELHYHERLVRLPGLGMGRRPVPTTPPPRRREDLGLSEGDFGLWCCQSLFKYMPCDDALLVELARRLPQARFLLCRTGRRRVDEAFLRRLGMAFDRAGLDIDRQVRLLPRLDHANFLATGAACDLYLDSLAWSGGVTSIECLEAGMPAVTVAGRFMRSRQTAAFLRRLDVADAIAPDRDSLVELVVTLADDRERLLDLRTRIRAGSGRLSSDRRVLPFLEEVLLDATSRPPYRPLSRLDDSD